VCPCSLNLPAWILGAVAHFFLRSISRSLSSNLFLCADCVPPFVTSVLYTQWDWEIWMSHTHWNMCGGGYSLYLLQVMRTLGDAAASWDQVMNGMVMLGTMLMDSCK
jgi:hypothetical protein